MIEEFFEGFCERMANNGVASPHELIGCSEEEIKELEDKYGLCLPESYRKYLQLMGHKSGRLFTHDHLAVFYPWVLALTAAEPDAWKRLYDHVPLQLPTNTLLINSRYGDYYEYLCCEGGEDAPVLGFTAGEWEVTEAHPSVMNWLEFWCDQAEQAIAIGFFKEHPQGVAL